MSRSTNITRDQLLNLATEQIRARGGLTATVRALCVEAAVSVPVDVTVLAPLADALTVGSSDQIKVLRATFGAVSLEVFGQRWGFKDGSLAPSQGAGGRPPKTTEEKLRAFLKAEGWKATLDALYAIAQQDAEAARELLAVVEVLAPKN